MRLSSFVSVSALVLGSGAAFAGGVVAPVVDVAPVVVTPVSPIASAWGGAYVGGSLGYSFGGDDTIGLDLVSEGTLIGRGTDLGDADLKGVTAGAHVGYRWQRAKWVFGPELGIEGGSIDGSDDVSAFGLDGTIESEINYIVSLVMKTGYEVTPGTLIYGTAGVAHGDFDYTGTVADDSQSVGYSATGYALGLGVERKMNDRMSVFAEYQYRDFGREDLSFVLDSGENVETIATPTHSNVKVGANFTF
jgi:outer membrane immunogenic protein